MQIIIVCYVYGVTNFLNDVSEMLRIESKEVNDENNIYESNLSRYWRKLKIFFGPTGSYIKWSWSLFSPIIIGTLLVTSIFHYERVRFSATIVPWAYELIAWVVMIGPLFVVPFTCAYTIYEAYKRGKPIISVIDTSNWKHKPKEEEERQPKHQIEMENDYMYIDPITREPTTKSNRIDVLRPNEDNYSRFDDRIREWAERSAKSEPFKTVELATIEEIELTTRNKQNVDELESEYSMERMSGRLQDWEAKNSSERTTKSDDQEPQRPYFIEDYR